MNKKYGTYSQGQPVVYNNQQLYGINYVPSKLALTMAGGDLDIAKAAVYENLMLYLLWSGVW